jgi:dienelactone hydrolase
VDKRIKVGISSCGFSEILATFNENAAQSAIGGQALYGLAKIGRSTDYLAFLAPRPFLMTRGLWEYGGQSNPQSKWFLASKNHVEKTKEIENYARKRYHQLSASENLKTIYFDEAGGNHAFPPGIKKQAYKWLDSYLKDDKGTPGTQKDIIDVRYNKKQGIEHTKDSFLVKENELLKVLGDFPTPPSLNMNLLESVKLDGGVRHKIEYSVEEANPLFNSPSDKVLAYLFVPDHSEGQKLPAVIAIHQEGITQTNPIGTFSTGKLEPAGLGGDEGLHYGLELFRRGYVVICPDQFSHCERRRIKDTFTAGSEMERDFFLSELWIGQLLLSRRTGIGKRVYDLMRAADILCSLDYVDQKRIGAIGHSEGGNYLVYFMFVDKRIKVGVSSCGFFDLLATYHENAPSEPLCNPSNLALPGLTKIGKSADYIALLAPRPILMTRGLWEYGKTSKIEQDNSKKYITETENIERYARQRYILKSSTSKRTKAIILFLQKLNNRPINGWIDI